MTKKLALLICVAFIAGCVDQVECADGTFEVDGKCENGEGPASPACGPGTHFDFNIAVCVSDLPPTRCDENSTETVVDEDGVSVCVGNAPLGCAGPLACPTPSTGKVSVCGRLVDLETRERIVGVDASGAPCGDPTEDGPCSLQIELFDALAFAANPNAEPLTADLISIDDCGRYKAVNVELPFSGFIGVAVDNAQASSDRYTRTGIAFLGESGRQRTGLDAYATLQSSVDSWTTTADPPFAPTTFAEKGVYVALFMHAGEPVEGIQVTANGSTHPGDAYYFSDEDQRLTSVDSSMTATGPNGAALLVDSPLGQHSGLGGEVDGCQWESALATAIPSVVFVQEKFLVDSSDVRCE